MGNLTAEEIAQLEKEHGLTPMAEFEAKLDSHIAEIKRLNDIINWKPQARQLYKRSEALEILGTTRKTLDRWIKEGHIKTTVIGKSILIPRSEIDRLTHAHT